METETYTPLVEEAIREEFARASPDFLTQLTAYYLRRQGPGLVLARAECLRRGWPDPLPTPQQAEEATLPNA